MGLLQYEPAAFFQLSSKIGLFIKWEGNIKPEMIRKIQ
jgi:hypothetical protein